MIICVFGGRDFTNLIQFEDFFFDVMSDPKYSHLENSDVTILEGGAKGADYIGECIAKRHGFNHMQMKADWQNLDVENCVVGHNQYGPYNKLAGQNRNVAMAEICHLGIGAWDGKSSGTLHMQRTLHALNRNYHILRY